MRTKWLVFLVAALATAALWGCGSNSDSGGSDTVSTSTVENVGITNCIVCHELISVLWKDKVHGNPNLSPTTRNVDCLECHDPTGDGELMAKFPGETNRPVVACEACHGGGSAHRGVGPLPFPDPSYEQCAPCHEDKHGLTVASDFANSAHLESFNDAIWTDPTQTSAKATCSKCHTDEGGRKFKNVNGDRDDLKAELDDELPIDEPSVVQCRTCHSPHAEEVLLLDVNTVFAGSGEYETCITCHQLTYPSTDLNSAVLGDWMAENTYHTTRYDRTIAETHYDDPATSDVEGYVVKNANNGACADCHNLHENDNAINNEWGESGHAGEIAQAKQDAADNGRNVFTEPATAGWAGKTGSCAVCHTSTGGASYLDDPDNYDSSTLDFSHLTGSQKELIYCWACHENYVEGARNELTYGALRNPGSLTLEDRNDQVMGTVPDIGSSNVCVKCHAGRGNMQTMIDDNNAGRVHYLAATGTLYNEELHTGYEYGGGTLNYDKPSFFKHDLIRMNGDSPESGSGPCFGCHMEEGAGHTFNVVAKDASGNITLINTQAVCDECHSSMTTASLQNSSDGYQDALDLLQDELVPSPSNNDELGATHNYNYLSAELGAYTHNSRYAKWLIFDALDYLDNGVLDGQITIDTSLHADAADWFGADASGNATRP